MRVDVAGAGPEAPQNSIAEGSGDAEFPAEELGSWFSAWA